MCGIVGFYQQSCDDAAAKVQRMSAALSHRGPDDEGLWVDEEAGIALGHRRLSIIDLSPAGHQPMISESGRYVIVFNGEIYNYREILKDMGTPQPKLRGHSDTEIMLLAIERWGCQEALKRFNGMFAFAVWDRDAGILTLARDRAGKKPLYYGWSSGCFFFASELKALVRHSKFEREINRNALALFMRYSYLPFPYSIYRNVFQLCPASSLTLSSVQCASMPGEFSPFCGEGSELRPRLYWSLKSIIENPHERGGIEGEAAVISQFEAHLKRAVGLRMISDVPVGAFLSGGIDSSLIVAYMQSLSTHPVRTFSIGFPEFGFDEAPYAKAVAKHIGTEHTELYVTAQEALETVPLLANMFDEPFADSSQIPTYLVSKLTRGHVTVSLSGDGGDELFGGYNRYLWADNAWRLMRLLPGSLRKLAGNAICRVAPARWSKLFKIFQGVLPGSLQFKNPGEKLHKLARLLEITERSDLYRLLLSHWEDSRQLVIDSATLTTLLVSDEEWPKNIDFIELMMFLDFVSYLPGDILTKVDRASMAVSLETRAPFLDYKLIEFAWSLPRSYRVRKGVTKWILRELLYRYVPAELVERPKMGFAVPMDSWLRGPLRDWAETYLGEERLTEEGYLDVKAVRQKWLEHLSGERDRQYYLWDVLMFESWLENQGKV